MATISEILNLPEFVEFRLVTCQNDLNKPFNNIGIHDYESLAEIPLLFGYGDFVLTTLFVCKNSVIDAEKYINTFLNSDVSAIAIKEVFYNELPGRCIRLAEEKGIPLMFYPKHILAENIIVLVKNLLNEEFKYIEMESSLSKLLSDNLDKQEEILFRKKINKDKFLNIGVAYLKKKKINENEQLADVRNIRNAVKSLSIKHNVFLNTYEGGIIIFLGFDDDASKCSKTIEILFDSVNNRNDYCLGYKTLNAKKNNLISTVNDAMLTARACYYDNKCLMSYEEIGIYDMILPENENRGLIRKSKVIIELIKAYDAEHNANLLDSAKTYINCDGDITKTAKILHQHTNTIRYRLNKLKDVINSKNFYVKLYIAIKINKMIEYEDKIK